MGGSRIRNYNQFTHTPFIRNTTMHERESSHSDTPIRRHAGTRIRPTPASAPSNPIGPIGLIGPIGPI
jgi:hypothetical protein